MVDGRNALVQFMLCRNTPSTLFAVHRDGSVSVYARRRGAAMFKYEQDANSDAVKVALPPVRKRCVVPSATAASFRPTVVGVEIDCRRFPSLQPHLFHPQISRGAPTLVAVGNGPSLQHMVIGVGADGVLWQWEYKNLPGRPRPMLMLTGQAPALADRIRSLSICPFEQVGG